MPDRRGTAGVAQVAWHSIHATAIARADYIANSPSLSAYIYDAFDRSLVDQYYIGGFCSDNCVEGPRWVDGAPINTADLAEWPPPYSFVTTGGLMVDAKGAWHMVDGDVGATEFRPVLCGPDTSKHQPTSTFCRAQCLVCWR